MEADVIIVGGGPAGLSAALTLGRVRRRVVLASDGPTRNARAPKAHNIFTRDGTPPSELVSLGRRQLEPYDVAIRDERVIDAEVTDSGFVASFAGGGTVTARGMILAIGVRDVLPPLAGLNERWGRSVFHCPYCHGWEVAGRPLAIYGRTDEVLHLTKLIRGLSDDVVVLTDGSHDLSEEAQAALGARGIGIRNEPIERLRGEFASVQFENGEILERAGLFIAPKQELASDLPHRLGCGMSDDGRVEADETGRTSIARLFVAGDAGPGIQSVPAAASRGSLAAALLNYELLEEGWQS